MREVACGRGDSLGVNSTLRVEGGQRACPESRGGVSVSVIAMLWSHVRFSPPQRGD